MFLWRVLIALVLQQCQREDQFRPRLGRFNYFINKSTLRRYVRIGKLFFKLVYTISARRLFIFGFSDFAAIQNIDRSL